MLTLTCGPSSAAVATPCLQLDETGQLIVGTEDCRILVMDPTGTAVDRTIVLPAGAGCCAWKSAAVQHLSRAGHACAATSLVEAQHNPTM